MLDTENGINLIKFYATWCGPCKTIAKTVESLKSEFPSINFKNIDIDDEPQLVKKFKIKSVPTIVILDNDIEIKRIT